MRRINRPVFDEVLGTQIGGIDVFATTNEALSDLLGQYDQLGLQAIADHPTGSGMSIEIRIETSCDGRSWVTKNALPEIPLSPVNATGITLLPYGMDDGTRPNYVLVRLAVRLAARGAGSVHLRIYVTARDQGGVIHRAFAASQLEPVPVKLKPIETDPKKLYLECVKTHPIGYCRHLYPQKLEDA